MRPACDTRVASALEEIAQSAVGVTLVLGYPAMRDGVRYNVAGVVRDGVVEVEYRKMQLPNYSVFDEQRYFEPGANAVVFEQGGVRFGVTICEDIWFDAPVQRAAIGRGAGPVEPECLAVSPGQGGRARGPGR